MADAGASASKGLQKSNMARLKNFYDDHVAVLGSKAVMVVARRPGPCIMVTSSLLFVVSSMCARACVHVCMWEQEEGLACMHG